jgi:general secretion pathway protein H
MIIVDDSSLSRAFTLLEMLAVILIMLIGLSVLAVAVHHGLEQDRARSAGHELVLALRQTRSEAINSGQPTYLSFDPNRNSYRPKGKPAHPLPEGMLMRLTTTALASGQPGFTFYPSGSSSGGNIVLQSDQRAWRIDVSWLTGDATLRELASP